MSDRIKLEEGHVIELKEGMQVYAELPEKFIYINTASNRPTIREVIVGDVYKAMRVDVYDFRSKIYDVFKQRGIDIKSEFIDKFIEENVPKSDKDETFMLPPGKFVVTETRGSADQDGSYADKIICMRLDTHDNYDGFGDVVSFYQEEGWTAVITPEQIQPIGKMRKTFE